MPEVRLTEGATADLERLPRVIHARILKLIERLQDWPNASGAKPLTGKCAGQFRLRTGDYRLQFRLVGGVVYVLRIGHRDGFYDE